MIKAQNLSYRIDGKPILESVSLVLGRGERMSVVGPNGAGKSTLLKCLARIYQAAEGEIEIDGRKQRALSQRELAKLMSYIPQADGFVPPYTVAQFVLMGRYPHLSPFSTPSAEDREAVDRAMSWTGIEEFSARRLDSLSGGERQKVFIAAAFAQDAPLLLLDEPTTFLDPKHQDEVRELLVAAQARGTSMIAVTHDLNEAVLGSDKILALNHGREVYQGDVAGFMQAEVLQAVYGKSFVFVDHPQNGRRMMLPNVMEGGGCAEK